MPPAAPNGMLGFDAMKRALKVLGGVVLALALLFGFVWFSAFSSNRPIVDGQKLAPAVETVKDGFVSAFLLDAQPGKLALIDAGKDGSGSAILAAITRQVANCSPAPRCTRCKASSS